MKNIYTMRNGIECVIVDEIDIHRNWKTPIMWISGAPHFSCTKQQKNAVHIIDNSNAIKH